MAFLLPRRRLHAARDQVDRAVRAAVGIHLVVGVVGDRVGAGDGAGQRARGEPDRRSGGAGSSAAALLALVALNYLVPVGRVAFDSRIAESLFYGALVFSPVFCAGLLFSSSFKESSSTADDFGANLLGAMVGGVGEYLSLLAGYRFLLVLVAVCYIAAARSRPDVGHPRWAEMSAV